MAIVQISQITNRLGLNENLPQLAGGELGWSTDTRQLYIGNGTLQQGAPVIGNTEILTEFSDILNLAAFYTYKGTAAGYTVQTGPSPGSPVVQSMQNWMDQWASVKDFGATGDGTTDDTAAINRALYQLYCRSDAVSARRSLFFPAGVYKVTSTIKIPSYATLYGEGPRNSIIQAASGYDILTVAQTADSNQQIGASIGTDGGIPPTDITITNMAFQRTDVINDSAVFLVEDANSCHFTGVSFIGAQTSATIPTTALRDFGVTFTSTPSLLTTDITFENCLFTNVYYGIATDYYNKSVAVANSEFNTLYQGVTLGFGAEPEITTGFRITNNLFDNIYSSGIIFGPTADLNASGYNIFYDVGNNLQGVNNPTTPIVDIQGDNNVSIGDMFARSDADANIAPRVYTGASASIAITNGSTLHLGTNITQSGTVITLANDTTYGNIVSIDTASVQSFKIDYSIKRTINGGAGTGYRTGTFWVVSNSGTGDLTYTDDYVDSAPSNPFPSGASSLGVTLSATQNLSGIVTVQYTTTDIDSNGQMSYTLSYFNFPNT